MLAALGMLAVGSPRPPPCRVLSALAGLLRASNFSARFTRTDGLCSSLQRAAWAGRLLPGWSTLVSLSAVTADDLPRPQGALLGSQRGILARQCFSCRRNRTSRRVCLGPGAVSALPGPALSHAGWQLSQVLLLLAQAGLVWGLSWGGKDWGREQKERLRDPVCSVPP